MLIASLSVGDSLVTLVMVTPLSGEEIARGYRTYNLTFTDIPTDKSYTKSIVGENDAMVALAAWIVADDVDQIKIGEKMLREDPCMKPHMP